MNTIIHRFMWVFPLLLLGCATQRLEDELSESESVVKNKYGAHSVAVSLRTDSQKYERFRANLERAMRERYVVSKDEAIRQSIDLEIEEIHFDHKGASFATGGASGGNWFYGRLRFENREGTEINERFGHRFNTGGGYTIFQNWEDRMIKAILVEIDRILRENEKTE